MNRRKLSPYVQIVLHLVFMTFYNAQGQGLIPDDHTGKWATTVMGSLQSVLAIYGIFSPSPNGKASGSSKPEADKR